MKILTFIEIDIPFCANTYGVAPCTASLSSSPPTGTRKCFNTPNTCQDRLNYIDEPVTIRFSEDKGNPPKTIDAIASITNVSFTPAKISLGKDLGTRASLSVTFKDHPWTDIGPGYDKYRTERPYDPKEQGTYWGKFRARQPFLRGKNLRWITGYDDQSLGEMITRNYVIDSFTHNASNGSFTIIAKDVLKFADDDRAQAPALSNGFLNSDVTDTDALLPLVPVGVGEEYPVNGYAAIGGKEIVLFGRDSPPGNDASTTLLIHTSGVDGSAIFTDTSAVPKAITVVGNTAIFNNFVKFGGGGAYFDGSGDALTLADNAAWEFGSGDFTIDFWQRFQALTATRFFFTHYTDANNRYFLSTSSTGALTFSVIAAGVTTVTMTSADGVIAADGVIRHIAVIRNGNVWRITVDGIQVATVTNSAAIPNFTSLFRIGSDHAGSNVYTGYIWEFRVSNDIARWTTFPFTPPVIPYQTSSDNFYITRAQLNTEASEHNANDRVQLVLRYSAQDPANIIRDLLVNYAGVPDEAIPLFNWLTETSNFLSRLFSADIAEPTGVNTLLSEIIEDGALCLWWDEIDQLVKLRVLRTVPLDALQFDQNNYMRGSFSSQEQPNSRVSQIWRYFAKRNPLLGQTDPDNYRSVVATVDLEAETDYGSSVIHKIYSRWIPFGGRTIADKANELYLSRFRVPPRQFRFSTFKDGITAPILGQSYRIAGLGLQDDTGEAIYVPVQIDRLKPNEANYDIEAEEMLIVSVDLTNRIIAIDVNTLNIDLREIHDSLYPAPTDDDVISGVNLLCTIDEGVIVGSADASLISFDVGDWPVGFPITIRVTGRIVGSGGDGGFAGTAGEDGGTALYTRFPIDLEIGDGEIWGGGGGGGGGSWRLPVSGAIRPGGGGGGGAGNTVGSGGEAQALTRNDDGEIITETSDPGSAGSVTTGGAGGAFDYNGGNGGALGAVGAAGQSGGTNSPGAGGAAGNAIDGVSFATVTVGPGDVIGPQVN